MGNDFDETRKVDVEFKAAEEENRVEFIASVFGTMDKVNDIMEPGAFKKTIQERVPAGLVKFLDSHTYDIQHTLGTVIKAEEREEGLWGVAEISKTPSAQEAKQKMLEGHIDKLSIGFDTIQEEFETKDGERIRYIKEVKLYEISAAPIVIDEDTRIVNVKAVVDYQDLPLADRNREWDDEQAESRLRAMAGGSEDLEDMDWSDYQRGFVWYNDEEPEQVGSYKLPIATVIDDTLTAVPRGIFAAAAAVEGARGGVDIPDTEMDDVRGHLENYYQKMRNAFDDEDLIAPWNEKSETRHKAQIARGIMAECHWMDQKNVLEEYSMSAEGVEFGVADKQPDLQELAARNAQVTNKTVEEELERLENEINTEENSDESDETKKLDELEAKQNNLAATFE